MAGMFKSQKAVNIIRSLLPVIFIGLLMIGCGGGAGGDSTTTGGTSDASDETVLKGVGVSGTPVSDDERIAAFHEISSELAAIKDLSGEARLKELAGYLASRPEFEAAGYDIGGAWGRFTDGRLVVFDDNDETQPSVSSATVAPPNPAPTAPLYADGYDSTVPTDEAATGSANDGALSSEPSPLRVQSTTYTDNGVVHASGIGDATWEDIPDASHICLYDSTGKGFWISNLQSYINNSVDSDGEKIYAYTIDDAHNNATVEALENIPADCAVIGLDAHGNDTAISRTLKHVYSIYTATPISNLGEINYWNLLTAGQLTYYCHLKVLDSLPAIDINESSIHYAITADFAEYFWATPQRFSTTKPFVYFNVCRGHNAVAAPLVSAILKAGASLYAGWTYRSFDKDGPEAASYIFDRILGSNMYWRTSKKPHRPFGWDTLGNEMAALNLGCTFDDKYGTMAAPNSVLVFEPTSSPFKQLAPSIEYMEVDEKVDSSGSATLTIYGVFGNKQGEVWVKNDSGRNPLSIDSWAKDKITCLLQPDDFGDVFVKVNGNRSNLRRLSKWEGKVIFTAAAPNPNPPYPQVSCNLKDEVTWDLKVRADIDTYREKPETAPQNREVKWLPIKEPTSITTFSSAGAQVLQTGDTPPKNFTAVIWSGGGTVGVNNPEDTSISHVWYKKTTGDNIGEMDICFLGLLGSKITTVNPGTSGQMTFRQMINMTDTSLKGLFDKIDVPNAHYIAYIQFNDNGDILASNDRKVTAIQYGGVGNVPVTLTWNQMSIKYPPITDIDHGK